MNLKDEHNHLSRHNLTQLGKQWCNWASHQPYNLNAPMPAVWHLAVTLQSNNPEANIHMMRARLRQFSQRLNRATLGPRWARHPDRQWRWVATYEDEPHDDEKTPHWHLAMTTGLGLSPSRAAQALATEKRTRSIANGKIKLRVRRAVVAEGQIGEAWRCAMSGGEVRVDLLEDPDDERLWVPYIFKRPMARRFTTPAEIERAQDRIVFSEMFHDGG